jgi:hypothetical protein
MPGEEYRYGTVPVATFTPLVQDQALGNYFRGLAAYKRKSFMLQEREST